MQSKAELSRMSVLNENLKKLIQFQSQIDEFIEDLKSNNEHMICYEELQSKVWELLTKGELIENCHKLQIFLSKDPNGHVLYTYVHSKESHHHDCCESFQCTSKFQSTIPFNKPVSPHMA